MLDRHSTSWSTCEHTYLFTFLDGLQATRLAWRQLCRPCWPRPGSSSFAQQNPGITGLCSAAKWYFVLTCFPITWLCFLLPQLLPDPPHPTIRPTQLYVQSIYISPKTNPKWKIKMKAFEQKNPIRRKVNKQNKMKHPPPHTHIAKTKQNIKSTESFVLVNYSWECSLAWSVVYVPSNTSLENIDFTFSSTYIQNERNLNRVSI